MHKYIPTCLEPLLLIKNEEMILKQNFFFFIYAVLSDFILGFMIVPPIARNSLPNQLSTAVVQRVWKEKM